MIMVVDVYLRTDIATVRSSTKMRSKSVSTCTLVASDFVREEGDHYITGVIVSTTHTLQSL